MRAIEITDAATKQPATIPLSQIKLVYRGDNHQAIVKFLDDTTVETDESYGRVSQRMLVTSISGTVSTEQVM